MSQHPPFSALGATLLAALVLLVLAPQAQAVTSCGNRLSPPRGEGPATAEAHGYRPQADPTAAANAPQGPPAPGFSANQTGRIARNYFAVGNEPGWSVEVLLTRPLSMQVKTDNGGKTYEVTNVRARAQSWSGTAADGTAIRLNCTPAACQDTMSGQVFPGTASLVVGKKTLRGCGGFRD